MTRVLVNPALIGWARECAGYAQEGLVPVIQRGLFP